MCNVWASSRWSTSVHNIAARAKLSRKLWDKKVCLLWSLQILIFILETAEKNRSINFHRKYEFWQLRFLRKIVNLFHNNMQTWYPWLIHFNIAKEKQTKFMSSKDTDFIPSGRTLANWSLLVNGQTILCCFVARLRSYVCNIYIHSWQHGK